MRLRSRTRRVAIATTALCAAALLFRTDVASALVTRGDDLLRTGHVDAAVRAYDRAIALDPSSAVAADRCAFFLLVRRKPGDAARAYAIADRALRLRDDAVPLLVDRAFAEERLARFAGAERDFAAAAAGAHDPRYAHLAARMAERARLPAAVTWLRGRRR